MARIVDDEPDAHPAVRGYQARMIFMTGGAFTQQARDFLVQVDRPHLDKPFTESQLRRAIEAAMR